MEYDDNVKWTAALAAIAHEKGVAVEAELGRLAGEEDGLCVSEIEAKMTDPAKVILGQSSDAFVARLVLYCHFKP